MELTVRVEPTTSPLPRECSTTEPREPLYINELYLMQIKLRVKTILGIGFEMERATRFELATSSLEG
jgi:hypothetical protein